LGTRDVVVVVRNAASPYEVIDVRWEATTTAAVTLIFSSPPASNTVKVGVYAAVAGSTISIGSINDLGDVTISSAADGDFLRWNGTAWINDAVNLSTDTVGSYVQSLVAGTGITITNNTGEGATPTVAVDTTAIQARVTGVTDTEIGYLDGVSSAIQTQIDTKAPIASPTFTGTVTIPSGASISGFALLAGPTFTGTVAGITKTMVGLGNVDNTTDAGKPVSTAGQTALDLKANLASPTFTGTVTVPTPSNATDAVTKGYADALKQGLDIKDSVRVASTTNIAIATALINASVIDGVTVATGDRVLLKNQTLPAANGIYVVVASGAASRSADADSSAEVTSGLYVFVSEGTAAASMGFVLTTADPITLATTELTFTQFSGAGQVTAGAGLTKTGNTLDVVGTTNRIVVAADAIDIGTDVVTLTGTQTLTNKTLTSPVVNTPTGIVKGDVGLGNVDNTTDAGKPVSTAGQTALDLKANLASPTFTGTVVTPSGIALIAPALGTPASGVMTNVTGTASGLTAGNVTTNANLTGPITSVGNATSIASQTGTGTTFAMSVAPTFTGVPAAPTAAALTSTTQIATTAFVTSAVANVTLTGTTNEIVVTGTVLSLATNVTIPNNLVVTGDLTVQGTTVTLNTETLAIEDNIIVLNSNVTGSPSANAGVEIERGTSNNASILWNETSDTWTFSPDNTNFKTIAPIQSPTFTGTVTLPSGQALIAPALGTPASGVMTNVTGIVNAGIDAAAAIALSKLATGALPTAITIASANIVDGTIVAADLADGAVTSAKILDDSIVNADINSAAAIALSKLATGALPTAITIASANIVNDSIVDADINSAAAIALSKLATGALPTDITIASANIVDGTIVAADLAANAVTTVKILNLNVTTGKIDDLAVTTGKINANAVTNAKAAQMATKTYKGRTSASTGDAEDVGVATLKTDLILVKADVGLGNVDNTTDAGKPVSTAGQTALDLKANLISPTLVTPDIGAATGTSLVLSGDLTVNGTTTTINSTAVNVNNQVIFEGATADNYETTLTVVDPTADRTISLPNATDTLVGKATTDTLTNKTISAADNTLTIAPTDLTGVTSTASELNILDGATLSTTELNYVGGVTSAIQTQLDEIGGRDPVITLAGDLTGSITLTNLASGTLTATIAANSVALGTDTTGDYVGTITGGTGVTSSAATSGESTTHTLSIGQDVATSAAVTFGSIATGAITFDSGTGELNTSTQAITINTVTTVDTFALATYRTAKYLVQVTQGSKYTSSEVLLMHDGTVSYLSEYAVIELGASRIPLTIATAVSGSDVTLTATITDAAATNATVKVARTLIAV